MFYNDDMEKNKIVMTADPSFAEDRPNPRGCKWCGKSPGFHGKRYSSQVGAHYYTAPDKEEIEARMSKRF